MEKDFIDMYTLKDIKYPKNMSDPVEVEPYKKEIEGLEYAERNESRKYPEFTTYKYRKKEGYVQRTIDYVFLSKEKAAKAEVTGWLEPPESSQLNTTTASPTINYPSDHYALAYEVEFKNPKRKFPRFQF